MPPKQGAVLKKRTLGWYYKRKEGMVMLRTITVKGVGSASVAPDYIVISMNLDTQYMDYEDTLEKAAQSIEDIKNALEEIGFDKKDLKTTNFNVRTDYNSVKDGFGNYKRVFNGYICRHNLKVSFDFDTKRLAETLSAISGCSVNPELSIAFTVKDTSAVKEDLLRSATINAKEKAQILCEASGAELGSLINISYNWREINVYSSTAYGVEEECLLMAPNCLSDIEIEPEDINVSDSATFVWEIK